MGITRVRVEVVWGSTIELVSNAELPTDEETQCQCTNPRGKPTQRLQKSCLTYRGDRGDRLGSCGKHLPRLPAEKTKV